MTQKIPASLDLSKDQERSELCAFLQEVGIKIRFPQRTIATAIVFFHRFFTKYTFEECDKYIVGYTCLFLAGKVEESPKKLKDVINEAHYIRHRERLTAALEPKIREAVLGTERKILQVLGFDFTVDQPYDHLRAIVYELDYDNRVALAQTAWNFINDSLRTTLCIQYTSQSIASASIYLAAQFLRNPLQRGINGRDWLGVLGCTLEQLENISNQILDLYEKPGNKTEAPPAAEPAKAN